ncbi:MAG: D-Ala-D-Ala dipeptidase VanX [Gemmiger sp.]|nr:D-Ala-D-Ala dipeptidase VanX [Gemmiger sp.]
MKSEFVFIDQYVPEIRWDAKYATWDNFTGRPVAGYTVNRVVGSRALCEGVLAAQRYASAQGYGLLLWDGYRPQRAVDDFIRWSAQPEEGATKNAHYPALPKAELLRQGYIAAKSSHSRGSAIDLTLYRLHDGALVPMGGGFDLMDARSHHGAAGLTAEETENRARLREIMENSGFAPYQKEWWHYVLQQEPYPDTYFDFPVA